MYDACACFILFLTVESHLQWNPLVHPTILKISSTETTDSKPLPFYKQSKSSWDWSICITAYSRRLADLHGQGFHHTGSPFSGSSSHGMRGCCKHGYRNGACHGDFAGCESSPLVVYFSRSCGCVARGPFGDHKIWTCICLFVSQKDCRCAEEYRGPWIIQMEGGNTITSIVTRSDGLEPMKEVQLLIFLPWIFFLTPVNRVFR
jgi:hypothetical protein